jgi:undecaprenyl diphosphate synthase
VENTFPKHVGIVLDGNRRWAKARGLKTIDGHKEGAEVFKRVSLAAFEKGVSYLSAFVFSTENWQRAKEEVSFLMKLVVRAVELHLDEFHKKNIKIIVVGSLENVPKSVLGAIRRTEEKTSANSGGTLALCFNYGGRTEIVDAAKAMLASGVAADDLTEDAFHAYLYKPELPDVDLLIRTSGEQRTSGFMLWRAAYAELLFVPKMWPDFTVEDLSDCISEYSRRQRRFGK